MVDHALMRRWRAAVGAILLIGIVLAFELWLLPPEAYEQGRNHAADDNQSAYALGVQLLVAWWGWFGAGLTHDNLTTAAIVATALFTGTLWRATTRLWRVSRAHAGHIERSVNLLASTERAIVFDVYIDDNVQLEEDRFDAARRHPMPGTLFGSLRLRVDYRLKNYGKMPAFLVGDIEENLIVATDFPIRHRYFPNMHILQERVLEAGGGETQTISCQRSFERALPGIAHDIFTAKTQEVWFVARISYRDVSGASEHEHAFAYRYDRQRRRFVPFEHPDHTRDT